MSDGQCAPHVPGHLPGHLPEYMLAQRGMSDVTTLASRMVSA